MRPLGAILTCLSLLAASPTHGQQPAKVHRVGILVFSEPVSPEGPAVQSLVQGLREFGYQRGKNIELVVRSAENRAERLPQAMAELLAQKPDLIVAGSTPGALAAKKAAGKVPIVFAGVIDPVGSGIVPSLARPGGNITGVTAGIGGEGFTGKCIELLKETVPGLARIAAVVNPAYPLSAQFRRELQALEKALGVKFEVHEAGNGEELERALAGIGKTQAQAIYIAPDPFLTGSSERIAQFARTVRLPSMHYSHRFAEAGGLISYGGSLDESYRRAGRYVDKVLRGSSPGDLPVEQPTRFELVVNLKTAKMLGLTISPAILQRADRAIQ